MLFYYYYILCLQKDCIKTRGNVIGTFLGVVKNGGGARGILKYEYKLRNSLNRTIILKKFLFQEVVPLCNCIVLSSGIMDVKFSFSYFFTALMVENTAETKCVLSETARAFHYHAYHLILNNSDASPSLFQN